MSNVTKRDALYLNLKSRVTRCAQFKTMSFSLYHLKKNVEKDNIFKIIKY